MNHMNELWACRTPQDFAAVQSDMMRETVETALECSRRIADMSVKMAEDAGEQIKQSMEGVRRVA
jgi:phasin family protein